MRRRLMISLAAALAIPLAGCQTMATGVTEVCSVWRPISWSKKDTPQTIDEVKGNNARQEAWCN